MTAPPQLIRYNVVPMVAGSTWVYEAADDGQFLFADSALERIAKLTAERDAQYEFNAGSIAKIAALEAENTRPEERIDGQTVNVQVSNRVDIAHFTGLPLEDIRENTILQLGPYVALADYEKVRADNKALLDALKEIMPFLNELKPEDYARLAKLGHAAISQAERP